MPDSTSPAFPAPLRPNCIRDVHRKLSSIRDQLALDPSSDAYQFLCGRVTDSPSKPLKEAIEAFKKKCAHDDAIKALKTNFTQEGAIKAFKEKFTLDKDVDVSEKSSTQDGDPGLVIDSDTWTRLAETAGCTFAEVWQYELDALRARRQEATAEAQPEPPAAHETAEQRAQRAQRQDDMARAKNDPAKPPSPYASINDASGVELLVRPADENAVIEQAHQDQLAGLAFSGGGIRSATFNLGMLQALAELNQLQHFDYLSTVSGGGYIGGWFSKWLHRQSGKLDTVAAALSPGTKSKPRQEEPDEIRFLRQYSNYLTQRTGLFSADTWAMLATYFRNTALNLTIIAALLGAIMIIPRLLVFGAVVGENHAGWFATVGAVAALWAVFYIALSISSGPDPSTKQWPRGQEQGPIFRRVVLPLLVSAYTSSIAIWQYRDNFVAIWQSIPPDTVNNVSPVVAWVLAPGALYFVAWALGWFSAQMRKHELASRGQMLREGPGHFLCAVAALGAGALLLTWSVAKLADWQAALPISEGEGQEMLLLSFGMPFLLSVFGVALILAVGLVGRMYNDSSREWWSRQGGWTAIITIMTFCLTAVSLFAPPILGWAYANSGTWTKTLVGSAWVGTTLAGLLLGHSNATGKRDSRPYLEWIAALAPLLFSVGAVALMSTIAYFAMLPSEMITTWGGTEYEPWGSAFDSYFAEAAFIDWRKALLVMLVMITIGMGLARRVDINKFSLYMMYRNRLVRAYLGASNPDRNPNPFTGFDENDDVHLDDLLATQYVIQRPYPIVNTTLNLVKGKELAWQTRKAGGFALTPAFCGFELPRMSSSSHAQAVHEAERGCFRRTSGYRKQTGKSTDEETGVKLGMAMAISGAAASPNMGYHSSPALSFLMTLFNVRLGRWFANPRNTDWSRAAPKFGIKYLLYELFGLTDADAPFVYLSDGGHFENLGIYELVRRRCRLIVVIDASADGQLDFDDLGNAIRKCATDLHVEIDIDANLLLPKPGSEFSQAHCVIGEILYDRTDPADSKPQNGTLLYIKPSLISDEFAEVLNYRKTNKDFPHQSTADQWFDETQFESYRSLGYRIGMAVFNPEPQVDPAPLADSKDPIPHLAYVLTKNWGKKQSKQGAAETNAVAAQTAKESTKGSPEPKPAENPAPAGVEEKFEGPGVTPK